jgi:hypothetical protein
MTDYLYTSGGFPSSPSSGDSLVINGLFYDWTGTAWKVRSTVSNRVEFTATANQATKTGLTYFVGSIDCYINGAKMLLGTDFTATNGTSVTFTPALDLDDEVQLIMGVSASSAAGGGVVTGTTLPDPVSAVGSLFFKTDDNDLYVSNGTDWELVSSAAATVQSALGGSITTTSTHKIHTFTTSGTFEVVGEGVFEYLVIAGGGGAAAGGNRGGGAGAGGYRNSVSGETSGGGSNNEGGISLTAGNYAITVGAGGTGAAADNVDGGQGNDSSIASLIIALGGGRGKLGAGASGGSGSGSSGTATNSTAVGSGTTGQGYSGGSGITSGAYPGGGGGGAGAVGASASGSQSGAGGAGQTSSITGSAVTRAGGGGAGSTSQSAIRGLGGSGGGGAGAVQNGLASSGLANSGGGGGAAGNESPPALPAGSGGSGIVIIRYAV